MQAKRAVAEDRVQALLATWRAAMHALARATQCVGRLPYVRLNPIAAGALIPAPQVWPMLAEQLAQLT